MLLNLRLPPLARNAARLLGPSGLQALRRSLTTLLLLPFLGSLGACGGGGADAVVTSAAAASSVSPRVMALSVTPTSTSDATADAASWTPCATEGNFCSFTGSRQVRFGTAGVYATRTLVDGTACSTAVFGDPVLYFVKSCDIAAAAVTLPTPTFDPSLWTLCASEGGSCAFTGTREVRYGTPTSAALLTLTAPVSCSNGVFDDPAVGAVKACWYANATATPVQSGSTPCATEGGYCSFTDTRVVQYGAATAQVSGIYKNGVACSNAVFGDPAPGVVKTCSVSADATAAPVTDPTVASISMAALTSATMGVPVQVTAGALDAQGAAIPGAALAWGVADTAIATVDASGLVTPLRSGYTRITASAGGQVVSGILSVRGPTPIPVRSGYVGTNVGGISYYSSIFPFADLMKSGGGWASRDASGTWGTAFPSMSANGYPTSLAPGQQALSAVAWDGSHYAPGRYTLLWDGEGSMSFPLSNVRVVQSAANRIVVETTGDANTQLWVGIDSTNPANPVRNVRFLWPGTESTYATQPFNPEYLTKTAPYSMLRFMDWGATNGSPVVEWADRAHLEDATWTTTRGVPIEAMIELANSLHVDPWFCIPHMASDDYVGQFARLLHTRLDPTLKPHIEYSNEVWNTGFAQTQWASAQSDRLGLDRPWGTPSLFYARRAVQMFKIMQQVWGAADAPRLVRVLAGQAAWTQFLDNALAYADTAANADVMAIAPYFIASSAADPANLEATLNLSASQLVDQMLTHIRAETKAWLTSNAALAARYRLTMKAYESGPGDTTYQFPSDRQQTLTALFGAANASPRMADAYAEYYRQWRAVGGSTVMQYYDIGGWSQFGFWGAMQYVTQDPATSSKYQALLAVIAGNPTAASATALTTGIATSISTTTTTTP